MGLKNAGTLVFYKVGRDAASEVTVGPELEVFQTPEETLVDAGTFDADV